MQFPTSEAKSHGQPSAGALVPGKAALKVRPSIFARLVYGSLAIVIVMAGVNLYALFQLRELTELSTQLVTYHYPTIEGAKRLLSSLYAQLGDEKKYRAVRDQVFVANFKQESEAFRQGLAGLQAAEISEEGAELLQEIRKLQDEYSTNFLRAVESEGGAARALPKEREALRDSVIARITAHLQSYIVLHEAKISTGVNESSASSARAESVTRQLIILAVLVALGFAAVVSYSILRPLRRLQTHIQRIGQGHFGTTVDVEAPNDLEELVQTVNWMAKKLQELDDMKAEFIAHVSHELRTPLASIQEGTQLLLDEIPGPLTPQQRETLGIMMDSSRRLIHLISTLLDLSKMEAGMMEYRIVLTDLEAVAEASVSKLRLLADAKHVQVLIEAPEDRVWVPADGPRIEQVLDNLLSNAVKFSPGGGVVHLGLQPDAMARAIRITVSDSGPGIAPEDLPHLFDRFYQGRKQVGSGLAGSGLGLALAKKVVEAHGGQIWVESERGKGTTVCLLLPFPLKR